MAEQEQSKVQKRQTAYKLCVADILKGELIKDEFSATRVNLNGYEALRVNVIATMVFKSIQGQGFAGAIIDDGTGRISLRAFENADIFQNTEVGDAALIIGKIREFNGEKYLVPEILKKIENPEWVKLRNMELRRSAKTETKNQGSQAVPPSSDVVLDVDVYSLIRKLDSGDGVTVDDVMRSCSNKSQNYVEATISRLLENGDIFEVKPGRLKVLE